MSIVKGKDMTIFINDDPLINPDLIKARELMNNVHEKCFQAWINMIGDDLSDLTQIRELVEMIKFNIKVEDTHLE